MDFDGMQYNLKTVTDLDGGRFMRRKKSRFLKKISK
tara:strand:+ start:288 stop:395 length:108 start_codon:yes stop_codon:yes gene_type:complete